MNKSDSNDERVSLRRFQKKDSYRELGLIENQIIELEREEKELNKQDKDLMEKIKLEEKEKLSLVRQLYKIDESYDIDNLTTENGRLLSEKRELEKQLESAQEGTGGMEGVPGKIDPVPPTINEDNINQLKKQLEDNAKLQALFADKEEDAIRSDFSLRYE